MLFTPAESCMQNFCEKAMGSRYVNQDAFSPSVVMSEASSSTPIFFILFPGYSPSKEIEAYAREVNHTVENGKLTLISMGQVSGTPALPLLCKITASLCCCARGIYLYHLISPNNLQPCHGLHVLISWSISHTEKCHAFL